MWNIKDIGKVTGHHLDKRATTELQFQGMVNLKDDLETNIPPLVLNLTGKGSAELYSGEDLDENLLKGLARLIPGRPRWWLAS